MGMRRKDREVLDMGKINEFITKADCCRIGFNDNGKVYIVPLNFGFAVEDGKQVFYFHGAKVGRKVDLIESSNYVGFELDGGYELQEADKACGYSAKFFSVIGNGKVYEVKKYEEKVKAVDFIMLQISGRNDWKYPKAAIDETYIFKLEVEEISCKEKV